MRERETSQSEASQQPLDRLTAPVWEGHEAYNESVLPLRDLSGALGPIPLLYDAEEILSVRSATLLETYEPGRDYRLEGGRLVIPGGSRIPGMAYRAYYLAEPVPGASFPHSACGHICFAETTLMHDHQIVVSYTHGDVWPYPVPQSRIGLLPRTEKALKAGGPLRLLIFGDSISTGVNASGAVGAPPHQAPWYDLAAQAMGAKTGSEIILLNTVEEIGTRIIRIGSLVVLSSGFFRCYPDVEDRSFFQKIRSELRQRVLVAVGAR